MTTSKAGTVGGAASQPTPECCMCGDYGFSYELFQCKVCQFRSQHRYCSNLYPKADSYRVCNWCLNQKDDTPEKTQNSSNSSSSNKNNEENDGKIKKKKIGSDSHAKAQRGSLQLPVNGPIKKQKSPERSPTTRKRIIASGCMEERLTRTNSEGSGITKHVFRNKVRRYKLLDEVSS